MHGSSGRVRLYRVFASSISDVQILNKKLAVIMPKPTADISYIPQKVWDSLLRPKKTEYYNMQRHFALSHNALRFVGLQNARQLLAKTAQNVPAISIFTWLTRVQSTDNFILFPKVFLCEDGDIELWYHMSHDKETRAWLSTALAEIAKLSGINWEINPAAADAMFKQPLKVWNSLAKLKRGVSLPAQRSVFMDYSPPTGIITFPTRAAVQNRQRKGPKSFKLVYDMDVATTVSALTNDDTKSRALSKSRKSARNRANKAATATSSTTTPNTESSEQLAAKVAAMQAIAIADAAVTKYPPRAPLAHQGAYDTISDAYGNRLPVVRLGDKWVPLTADSLRESRKKAPPPNFGLAGKVQGTPNYQSGSTGSTVLATPSVETTTANAGQIPSATVATLSVDTPGGYPVTTQHQTTAARAAETHQQQGAVKTKVTAIEARVAAIPDYMDTTIAMEGPLDTAGEDDVNMVVGIDDESTQYGSAASLGTNSCVTTTTQGESLVTWATVAAHQVYDPAAMSETVAHNQDAGSVGSVDTNFQSSLVKLQSKSKQQQEKTRRQQSSLEAAAAAGAVIYQPQGSSLAKVAAQEKVTESAIVPTGAAAVEGDDHASSAAVLHKLAKLQDENALLMQMVLRLQKENDTARDKVKASEDIVATAAAGGQSSLARSSQSHLKPPPIHGYAVAPAAIVGQSSIA